MILNLQATPEASEAVRNNFDEIQRRWPPEPEYRGTGAPNGVVTAGPGAQYINLASGQRYTHESAVVSNIGWVLK